VAGLSSAAVNANALIDVRAVVGSNPAVTSAKVVNAALAAPGSTITFNVFAVITPSPDNGNPGDEGFLLGSGSFLSTDVAGGALRGNMTASRPSTFNGSGSSNGLPQDLDGDGDLDVGSNTPATSANFFAARATSAPSPVFGQEVQIGTLTMTVGQLLASAATGGHTDVNFRLRNNTASAASWFENGSTITPPGGTVVEGSPVVISAVPEPMTLGLAGLAGMSLLGRRRK